MFFSFRAFICLVISAFSLSVHSQVNPFNRRIRDFYSFSRMYVKAVSLAETSGGKKKYEELNINQNNMDLFFNRRFSITLEYSNSVSMKFTGAAAVPGVKAEYFFIHTEDHDAFVRAIVNRDFNRINSHKTVVVSHGVVENKAKGYSNIVQENDREVILDNENIIIKNATLSAHYKHKQFVRNVRGFFLAFFTIPLNGRIHRFAVYNPFNQDRDYDREFDVDVTGTVFGEGDNYDDSFKYLDVRAQDHAIGFLKQKYYTQEETRAVNFFKKDLPRGTSAFDQFNSYLSSVYGPGQVASFTEDSLTEEAFSSFFYNSSRIDYSVASWLCHSLYGISESSWSFSDCINRVKEQQIGEEFYFHDGHDEIKISPAGKYGWLDGESEKREELRYEKEIDEYRLDRSLEVTSKITLGMQVEAPLPKYKLGSADLGLSASASMEATAQHKLSQIYSNITGVEDIHEKIKHTISYSAQKFSGLRETLTFRGAKSKRCFFFRAKALQDEKTSRTYVGSGGYPITSYDYGQAFQPMKKGGAMLCGYWEKRTLNQSYYFVKDNAGLRDSRNPFNYAVLDSFKGLKSLDLFEKAYTFCYVNFDYSRTLMSPLKSLSNIDNFDDCLHHFREEFGLTSLSKKSFVSYPNVIWAQ
jgi:hypothetical protein